MAKFVLKHPKLDIDGTNLEDHASSLEITSEYEEIEFTSFCSDFKEYGQGMGDCTWDAEPLAREPVTGATFSFW